MMHYFAYGSNLDFRELTQSCPSAQFVCRATLRDHTLAFSRYSNRRECGVADVVPKKGEEVWGVVYNVADNDIVALDKREGFKPGRASWVNSYNREQRVVFADGDVDRPLFVAVYVANKEPNPPLPNKDYKRLIVDGARYWQLPEFYIHSLETIETA